jgi:hypothetical protein
MSDSFPNPPNLGRNEQDDLAPDREDDEDEPDVVHLASNSEDDEDEVFSDRDEQGNEPAALVPEGHDLEDDTAVTPQATLPPLNFTTWRGAHMELQECTFLVRYIA